MADIPNFGALASQQANENDDATRRTTWSNRPDQSNALGSTSWNQMPDGRWVNSTNLTGQAQGLFDTTMQGQMGLAGQVGAGLNYGSAPAMPTVGGYNQQVIDSWNALQEPGLAKAENAARTRASAMGLTMGSNAWGANERALGNTRTDAGNKAILAGYQQGNTEFDQALKARTQGTTEATQQYQAGLYGLGALTSTRQSLDPTKWNATVNQGASYIPENIVGAAETTFNAQRQNESAQQAERLGYANTAANAVNALGGLSGVGSAASGLWNWGKDLYSGWGSGGSSYTGSGDYDWTGAAQYF